jgi:hypothetical protein
MKRVLAAAAVLLLNLMATAPANASLIKIDCTYSVPARPSELEESALGGRVVQSALRSDCHPGEPASIEYSPTRTYSSPVHLLAAGLCKARQYDEERRATNVILRQLSLRGRCHTPRFERYVATTGISDVEFMALMRFWRDLPRTGVDIGPMLRSAPPGDGPGSTREMIRDLPEWATAPKPPINIAGDDETVRDRLPPEDRNARVFVVDDASSLTLTVAETKGKFKFILVDLQMP